MRNIAALVRPGYLFLAPAMLMLGLFFFGPIVASMLL